MYSGGALVVAVLVVGLSVWRGGSDCPGGHCLPHFGGQTLDGRALSTADLEGKVVLVNLWAVWCKPCVEEMPDLQALHEKYADDGLVVVGVLSDMRTKDPDVRAFIESAGVDYPIVRQSATGYETPATLPVSYLYDREGSRVWGWLQKTSAAEFEARLVPLLTSQ